VNGWCAETYLPCSSSQSMSGNSITHRKLNLSAGISSLPRFCRSFAASRRILPIIAQACSHFDAAKKTMSPSSMLSFDFSSLCSLSERNFNIGLFQAPFSALINARPFAPRVFAMSSRFFNSPCVKSAKPFALKALIAPPSEFATDAKTLNCELLKVSVKSWISSSKRVSGLSTP